MSRESRGDRAARMTAWTSLVIAVSALIGVGVAIWQVRAAQFSLRVDNLLKMDAQFNSDWMLANRRRAAALLHDQGTAEIDTVLDFLDSLGLLVRKGAVDEAMAWSLFSDPAVSYAAKSQKLIQKNQHSDPTTWEDLSWLIAEFSRVDRRHPGARAPDQIDVDQYLMSETELPEHCSPR